MVDLREACGEHCVARDAVSEGCEACGYAATSSSEARAGRRRSGRRPGPCGRRRPVVVDVGADVDVGDLARLYDVVQVAVVGKRSERSGEGAVLARHHLGPERGPLGARDDAARDDGGLGLALWDSLREGSRGPRRGPPRSPCRRGAGPRSRPGSSRGASWRGSGRRRGPSKAPSLAERVVPRGRGVVERDVEWKPGRPSRRGRRAGAPAFRLAAGEKSRQPFRSTT